MVCLRLFLADKKINKMVIVRLMGGMGNQMFQFAAGKALAVHLKTELKLDDSYLKIDPKGKYTQRNFELNGFNMTESLISKTELLKYNSKIARAFRKIFDLKTNFLNESGHQFHPGFFDSPNNVIVNGYWQSEKYFLKYKEQIVKDLSIKQELLTGTEELAKQISNTNSVSIHIRRGDYVTHAHANYFHGICGLDYYKEAVSLIAKSNQNIELFIFSDDIEWCQQNIKLEHPTSFVDTKSPYKDLYLMQSCKHNIIANSSFSWWGAWLNKNGEKIVIAPKNWFADSSINTSDLCPEKWIRL